MTAAVEVRVCANPRCSRELVRRDGERPYAWERRRYCSQKCSTDDRGAVGRARTRSEVENTRRCAWAGCAGPLKRRVGERTRDWLDRRYCSRKCHESRYIPVVGRSARPVFPTMVADQRDQSWQPRAACRGADPNRFGPIEQHERNGIDRCRRAAAEFCRDCPVVAACHQYAEDGDEAGIWGGRLRQPRNGKLAIEPLLGPAAAVKVAS